MMKHYSDYYWKMGKPYGRDVVDPQQTPHSYKIVVDPYYKRYTVESYRYQQFEKIAYDSALLDFRRLKPADQMAWQKEQLSETEQTITCLLRDQDDRAILIEVHSFEGQRCRKCTMQSIHGLLLSTHHMYYTALGDHFNGVVLFDLQNKPVMFKQYDINPQSDEFTDVLYEEWTMDPFPALLSQLYRNTLKT